MRRTCSMEGSKTRKARKCSKSSRWWAVLRYGSTMTHQAAPMALENLPKSVAYVLPMAPGRMRIDPGLRLAGIISCAGLLATTQLSCGPASRVAGVSASAELLCASGSSTGRSASCRGSRCGPALGLQHPQTGHNAPQAWWPITQRLPQASQGVYGAPALRAAAT
eukprot:16449371-Heterocapsa_arctica.AAC.1